MEIQNNVPFVSERFTSQNDVNTPNYVHTNVIDKRKRDRRAKSPFFTFTRDLTSQLTRTQRITVCLDFPHTTLMELYDLFILSNFMYMIICSY